ncbi:MAG: polysaccharide biosynthesis C-terminal domain-containing protein [Oscillospiraceae bacterium]|nr:polysaccharide biosynthesis C-terminal domain-containing protein [Oscillospiraceae bacterium]
MSGSGGLKKQGFLYGSAVLIASAVIVKIIGALFRIPLANMLGGTGMGYFSAAYGIFMPVYAVSVTGLPAAAARSVSAAAARGRAGETEAVKRTALSLFGLVGLAGTAVILLGAYPLCRFVSGDVPAVPAVMAIAPSVLAGCLVSVYRGCAEGMRNMYPTAVSQVIEAAAKLIFGLALCGMCLWTAENNPELFLRITGCGRLGISASEAALPYGAAAAVLGITLSSFAGLVYMITRDRREGVRKTYSSDRLPHRNIVRIRKELLRTAVPAAVGALVINLTSLIDLVTVMRSLKTLTKTSPWIFSDLLGAGIPYSDMPNFIYGSFTGLAVTVFNLVPSVTNMFGKSMLPAAAAAKAEGDIKKLGDCSGGAVLAAALASVPAGLGISALAEPVLRTLFGGRELEISVCVNAMTVLGAAVPFVCISSAAFAVLQAADRADIPVKIMTAGAAVKLAGNLILTADPRLGVTGAAIATLLCYIFICFCSLIMLSKHGGFDGKGFFYALLKIFSCGLLCGASAFLSYSRLSEHGNIFISTAVSCGIGAIIYIISTYFSGIITKSTLKMLIS